ncbi:MAG: hypothetical protein NUW37_10255 [Planctomycetes bacterium]|nr:hypothetical protein [Planctomycetota bacterium]
MVCPFLEQNLRICKQNLRFDKMDVALEICMNNYTQCEIFKKKILKVRKRKGARVA